MNNRKKIFKTGAIVVSSIFLSYMVVEVFKENFIVAVNTTKSLNDNFYVLKKTNNIEDIKKGDVFGFTFSKEDSIYYPKGYNFIKYASCLEGEHLLVTEDFAFCDDRLLTSLARQDKNKNKLTPFLYDGIVPSGKIFASTPYIAGYDSRYWGFVDKKEILGVSIW